MEKIGDTKSLILNLFLFIFGKNWFRGNEARKAYLVISTAVNGTFN